MWRSWNLCVLMGIQNGGVSVEINMVRPYNKQGYHMIQKFHLCVGTQRDICTSTFIAVLPTTANRGNQTPCHKWINKGVYLCSGVLSHL